MQAMWKCLTLLSFASACCAFHDAGFALSPRNVTEQAGDLALNPNFPPRNPVYRRIGNTRLDLELWFRHSITSNIIRDTLRACVEQTTADMRIHGPRRVVRHYRCDPGMGGYVQMEPAMLPGLQRAGLLSYVTIFLVVKELEILSLQGRIRQSLWFRVCDYNEGLLAVGSMEEGTINLDRGTGHFDPGSTQ